MTVRGVVKRSRPGPYVTRLGSRCLIPPADVYRDDSGYPRIKFDGRAQLLSRLVLAKAVGRALTPSEFACHKCDNRECIEERHLYVGSRETNAEDALSRRPLTPGIKGTFAYAFKSNSCKGIRSKCRSGPRSGPRASIGPRRNATEGPRFP